MHSMEQQEANEEDKTNAGDDHSTQQEAVATFCLHNLGKLKSTLPIKNETSQISFLSDTFSSESIPHLPSQPEPALPSHPCRHLLPGLMWRNLAKEN